MRSIKSTIGGLFLALCASVAIASSAFAQDGIIDEVRFGGAWAQPYVLDADHPERSQTALNAEVLFAAFNFDRRVGADGDFLNAVLTPRLHLGATANLSNRGTSYTYAGLTWQFGLTERLFIETSFGLSVNNGKRDGQLDANGELIRARLGSNVTFRESVALGFHLTENVTMLLQLDHNSHARLMDDKNRGLTGAHVKFGYKF